MRGSKAENSLILLVSFGYLSLRNSIYNHHQQNQQLPKVYLYILLNIMKSAILCLAIVLGISLVSCSEADWVGPKYEGYPLLTPNVTGVQPVLEADGSYHRYDKADTGILVLNDSNIDNAIGDYKHLLINFYSKWCETWCVLFHPYYISAHDTARKQGLNVQFAQVEWNDNKNSVTKYNITTHPTQVLFIAGRPMPVQYTGPEGSTGLLKWLTAQLANA